VHEGNEESWLTPGCLSTDCAALLVNIDIFIARILRGDNQVISGAANELNLVKQRENRNATRRIFGRPRLALLRNGAVIANIHGI
jgi:hypothetical protein